MNARLKLPLGLPLGCDRCVLPVGYAGATFSQNGGNSVVCNFCQNHQAPVFLGGDQFLKDLALATDEKVGITVSGGKDSLNAWMWLVDQLGPDRVVAFNHHKVGLVHPLATANLQNAKQVLGTPLVVVEDHEMLPRFRRNFEAFLRHMHPAMVRVAFCAGCRVGISGKMFAAGQDLGIHKFVSAASYLELAPFKAATMKELGGGDEHQGLLNGIAVNPGYNHGDNLQVVLLEDQHCHKAQLTGGRSYDLYPDIRFFDMDTYFPNDPDKVLTMVQARLNWQSPTRTWHFDCILEQFKDLFYYGLLGYTEWDFHYSAMVRYGLATREEAISRLMQARHEVINSRGQIFALMEQLEIGYLIPQVETFYNQSRFLSGSVK